MRGASGLAGGSGGSRHVRNINAHDRAASAARFLILVQAVLDAVGETGVFDDAVGAAVKKSGLMDTLVEWGTSMKDTGKI